MGKELESRGDLLERAALDAARAWTQAYRAELMGEGRLAEGGWPGTVREARARAATEGARVLHEQSLTSLTHDELDRLARITYEEARRAWAGKARR